MTWKTVNNSDAGTVTKHGGNDLDKIASALNGNDVSDTMIFKTNLHTLKDGTTNAVGDLLVGNGTKYVRRAKGTALQVLQTNASGTDIEWAGIAGTGDITQGANVGSGAGQIFRDKTGGNTLNLKTLLAGSNVTITNNANDITIASTGGGGASSGPYDYIDWIEQGAAPANPTTDHARVYMKDIDANNQGLFMKVKKAGAFVEVQIA